MYLRVALEQPVWRFGAVNVSPGRCQGRGPRGFHTPYSPGPAWMQGPGRFGHVNVGGGWRAMARTPDNHDCASVFCASVSSDSRPCGRRCLAVWPLESGRVASGLSPRGVASFVHARLGVRGYQGRMVSNLPSPCPSTCYRCPDGALWWLASARTKRPTMGFSLIGALPAYEPRRQGGASATVR